MSDVTTASAEAGTHEVTTPVTSVSPSEITTISIEPTVPAGLDAPADAAPAAGAEPLPPYPHDSVDNNSVAEEPGSPATIEAPAAETSALPLPPDTGALNNSVAEIPAETVTIEPEAPVPGFATLGLSPELLKAVLEAGYTTPTPIQAEGIPLVLKRRDMIGIAQTGTGKTASFTLPMIELLARGRAKARMPRSLILEPTRELAAQVAESFEKYGKYNKLSMALLIGGVSFDDQDKKLDRGVDVLIATPGRLMDHFERGKLMLSQVQILVVDEADRMLDMGFIPDVEKICKLLPFTRQTLFYSATMPAEIRRLTEQFLSNPVRVEVTRPATTAINIKQELIQVPNDEWAKREALRMLIKEAGDITNAIVFCNKKRTVDIVAKSLSKHGFNAAPLHGDLDQSVRTKTLEDFRSGTLTILVASDVAARGLDIPAVSHVFNFDVPYHSDDYVHRVGRTGRAGRSGEALMLVTSADGKYVEAIEKLTKTAIPRRKLEGLAEQVRERPAREDRGGRDRDRNKRRSGGNGGGTGSNGRNHREHPIKAHGQVASMEPMKPVAEAAVRPATPAPVRQPERQQERQPERRPEPAQFAPSQRPARPPQYARNAQRPQPYQQPRVESRPVDISQLPAFLLRPVKLPKPVEKLEKAAEKPVVKPVKAEKPVAVEKPVVIEKPVMVEPKAVIETPVVVETPVAVEVSSEIPAVAAKPKRPRAPRKKKVVAPVEAPAAKEPDSV